MSSVCVFGLYSILNFLPLLASASREALFALLLPCKLLCNWVLWMSIFKYSSLWHLVFFSGWLHLVYLSHLLSFHKISRPFSLLWWVSTVLQGVVLWHVPTHTQEVGGHLGLWYLLCTVIQVCSVLFVILKTMSGFVCTSCVSWDSGFYSCKGTF